MIIKAPLVLSGGFHIAPHCAHTHSGAANNGARVIRAKHGRSRRYCAATNRHSQSKFLECVPLLSLEVAQPLQ